MYNESQITSRSAEVKQLQWILILQCVKHNLESNKKKEYRNNFRNVAFSLANSSLTHQSV